MNKPDFVNSVICVGNLCVVDYTENNGESFKVIIAPGLMRWLFISRVSSGSAILLILDKIFKNIIDLDTIDIDVYEVDLDYDQFDDMIEYLYDMVYNT